MPPFLPHSLKTVKETHLPYLLSCLRIYLTLKQWHSKLYFFRAIGLHRGAEVSQRREEKRRAWSLRLGLHLSRAPSSQPGCVLLSNSCNSQLSTGICVSRAAPLLHIHGDAVGSAIFFFPPLPSLLQSFRSSQHKAERNNKLIVYQFTSTYAKHSLRS